MSNDMGQVTRKWMIKTARKNLWRMSHWYDLDELIADGMLCWQIVESKYPKTNKPHRDSLFRTTFTNHIHRLANKKSIMVAETAVDHPEALSNQECQEAELRRFILENATPMLRHCLAAILDKPELLAQAHIKHGKHRETTNEYLCRLAGINPGTHDLGGELRHLLQTT